MPEEKIKILPEHRLLRRIPLLPDYFKPDGSLSSLAFATRKVDVDGLSVDLEHLSTVEKSMLDRQKFQLARIVARVPMELGLTCVHDPVLDNYAHALIQGNITRSLSRKLASSAEKVAR